MKKIALKNAARGTAFDYAGMPARAGSCWRMMMAAHSA